MNRRRPNRQPTFLWQAALILLPVVGLATFGILSLREDRLVAEQDARSRPAPSRVTSPTVRRIPGE